MRNELLEIADRLNCTYRDISYAIVEAKKDPELAIWKLIVKAYKNKTGSLLQDATDRLYDICFLLNRGLFDPYEQDYVVTQSFYDSNDSTWHLTLDRLSKDIEGKDPEAEA